MQPAATNPPDASIGSIVGVMLIAAVLIFAAVLFLAFRSIGRGPGNYDFAHQFVVLDASGSFVDDSSFVFTMNPDDFDVGSRGDDLELDAEGRVVGAALSSLFEIELGGWEDAVCLSEPFVFMWADSSEIAAEIPAGTCLDDRGETQVMLR